VGLYFYSPSLNSTRFWRVGEWLSAPLCDVSTSFCMVNSVVMWLMCTGYIGSKSFLEKVGEVIKELKQINPRLTYGMLHRSFYLHWSDWLDKKKSRNGKICFKITFEQNFRKMF
jgi:hypothetical protein